MNFDYSKLNKRIDEKLGLEELNKSIEWDGGDLYQRLEGESEFSIDEINKVCEELDIKDHEVRDYFFTLKNDKKELLEVSDKLHNIITHLEILIEVDNKFNGIGGDEKIAEILTWDYLNKAKDEAVETYELLKEIRNIR